LKSKGYLSDWKRPAGGHDVEVLARPRVRRGAASLTATTTIRKIVFNAP
jgi:hypothetical protein